MSNFTGSGKSTTTSKNPIWISLAILLVGLLATFWVSNYVRQDQESLSQKEFVLVCNEVKSKFITRINLQAQFLNSGSSLFESSKSVTRNEWKQFNKFSGDNVKFIGVQGFGFSTIIKKEQLKEHISTVRKEGFPQYKVFPEGARESYTSIIYLEPFDDRNARAFGFDMFSEPTRRQAMEFARDHNRPTLSGKVILRLETDKDLQAGTVMFVPVYKNAPINTIANRREAIMGWVFGAFRMDDLMKSILGSSYLNDKTNIRLQIYDNDTIAPKALLFDSQKNNLKEDDETRPKLVFFPFCSMIKNGFWCSQNHPRTHFSFRPKH